MVRQRRRDTAPELAIRRALHGMGMRYRVDAALPLGGVRRTADLLFPRARVAVFVDSCFWHACPDHGTWPRANAQWWRDKLEANRQRDADTNARLFDAGWLPVRVWEHEPAGAAAERIRAAVVARGGGAPTP
jgi:DNA mismatch endonuclease (patch repair protein)